MPKIAVIIPTYNRFRVLGHAIESVLAQDYQDFELWIVDDASTDETANLVKKYLSARVHYVRVDCNYGVSFARNLGVAMSQSDWVAFLDSDDQWLPQKLSKQMEFASHHFDIQLIHGEEIWIRHGKRVNQKKIHQKFGGWIFQKCLPLCLISPSAVIMKRELYQQMGGFDESFPVCEDYDLWLKITCRYEVGFISEPIIKKFGGHEDQLSQKYKAMDYWRIKAMSRLGKNILLSEEDLRALKEQIKLKGEILLNGYRKHGNLEAMEEIRVLLN
ncbi:MAG: glycosyltransferase [Pseudomonadota bacterium]